MFQVPKDLARHRVSLEQAFLKVAGSKGYSVIALREHEALSACRAIASQVSFASTLGLFCLYTRSLLPIYYSVIALREHEALSACRAIASQEKVT